MTLYFSRLTLKRDPGIDALRGLLDPVDNARRVDAHHRLLWSVFSDGPERTRDYIWRAEPNGRFYTLSQRPPLSNGLFDPPESKAFSPVLSKGDRLFFSLRANAVRSLSIKQELNNKHGRKRGKKVDVAMQLLHSIPGGQNLSTGSGSARSEKRYELANEASLEWLEKQGEVHGFSVVPESFVLEDYSTVTLNANRAKKQGHLKFGVFDMKGIIVITNPEAFIKQIGSGFGRAKAFGQGLMLIRRT